MKTLVHITFILLCISLNACNSNKENYTITNVQFKEDIYKPQYMGYDYGVPICDKEDVEEYRTRRLGQKIEIIHYDNSIKIRIIDNVKTKEFVLDKKAENKYRGNGIEATIDKKLIHSSIIITINVQKEIKTNLSIFDKYAEAHKQSGTGSNKGFWLMANKGIIITAKN